MSIALIQQILKMTPKDVPARIAWDAWRTDAEARAREIARYRDYVDGRQEGSLTSEQMQMLRLKTSAGFAPFSANHCGLLVSAIADRLTFTTMESDTPALAAWVQAQLDECDGDELQIKVHQAAVVDGYTFVMVRWDTDADRLMLSHEPAYDGREGVLPIYGTDGRLTAAIKVWTEQVLNEKRSSENVRVNVYYANRVERWQSLGGTISNLEPIDRKDWLDRQGRPLGVPLIAFNFKAQSGNDYGMSKLVNAIPLQDAINRQISALIMAMERSAFGMYVVIGADAPSMVAPGGWLALGDSGKHKPEQLNAIRVEQLAPSNMDAFLLSIEAMTNQLYEANGVPRAGASGSNASGEAMKQREATLLGEIRKTQTGFGSSWERVGWMMHAVQGAFGQQRPPAGRRLYAKWAGAALRDDAQRIAMIMQARELIGDSGAIELLADVFGWDQAKIKTIQGQRTADAQARLSALSTPFVLPEGYTADA